MDAFVVLAYFRYGNEYEGDEEDWRKARKLLTSKEKLDGTSTPRELYLTTKVTGHIVIHQLKNWLILSLERCVAIGTAFRS